jgi:REP element-mobilizing transposase RayT
VPHGSDDRFPIAYLITVTCYGSHLYGDANGSVDCRHNWFATPYLPSDSSRRNHAARLMQYPPYRMSAVERGLVLEAIQENCSRRHWQLIAAHVRSTHFHCIVAAIMPPEPVMNSIKANISRRLNESGIGPATSRRWTRHGSTRYLWTEGSVEQATRYVLEGQGEPMVYARGKPEQAEET